MAKPPRPANYPGVRRVLRHIPIEEYPSPIFGCPSGAEHVAIDCSSCGRSYPPPWTEKLPFEFAPVESKDGARWAVSALSVRCPTCDQPNLFNFPSTVEEKNTTLFGDEGFDWHLTGKNFVYAYAFVGLHQHLGAQIERVLSDAKRLLLPDRDPADWVLHCADWRDERWRRKNRVALSIQEINDLLKQIARSIAAPSDERFISAIILPGVKKNTDKRKTESSARDYVLRASLMVLTDFLTRRGFSVDFVLETQNDKDHRRNAIDYPVERIGRSLRHDLGFLYVSRGKLIGLPITVPKESRAELELADLVAFMVRRYFRSLDANRHTEFPLELLGEVFWGMFTPRGFGTRCATGFPWGFFFPGDSER